MPDDATEHPPGSPDLSNCDREPIHIPGAIQPHGALLAFDADLRLCGWSASASDWLAIRPAPDRPAAALGLGEEVLALLDECLASAAQGESPPLSGEVQANGHLFDVVVHMHQQRVLLEYEIRHVGSPEIASFALQANRAISRLRRTRQAEELLQIAVHEIRKLTGFDRVMAYRFRHDDSGDIVSEDVADDIGDAIRPLSPCALDAWLVGVDPCHRQSCASETAARVRFPLYCSSFFSNRSQSENASATDPAKPTTTWS